MIESEATNHCRCKCACPWPVQDYVLATNIHWCQPCMVAKFVGNNDHGPQKGDISGD